MKPLEKIIRAFDEFILSTGGNLDHRAAGNRDRKALLEFFKKLHDLPCIDAVRIMEHIMKEQLTIHNIDGSPYINQVSTSQNPCPNRWLVYDEYGRCLGEESG